VRALWILAALVLGDVSASYTSLAADVSANSCRGVTATVVGTEDQDRLVGTTADDVIAAGKGWDHIDGRSGDDLLCGGRERDILLGGPGSDQLFGQADGNAPGGEDDVGSFGDRLIGGAGDDRLDGRSGTNGEGRDVIRYPGARGPLHLVMRRHSARVGSQRDVVVSIEKVHGTRYADVLRGGPLSQYFLAGPGDDRLLGRGGEDALVGETGDDRVRGGGDDDYLSGGEGIDVAHGGPDRSVAGDLCEGFEQAHGCEE
jgi:Ca2+-binding RTX toxin-like protein